jgi:hypothetical protein
MLRVTFFIVMLGAVMLSVVMLSVAAPQQQHRVGDISNVTYRGQEPVKV